MSSGTLLQTELADLPVRRGKVRDIYELSQDRLLMVSTDRISAFDYVLPTGIPDKGRVLTQISEFWFEKIDQPHHLISTDLSSVELPAGTNRNDLVGRSMLVKKANVVPIECVVRGYLLGSGWKEYQQHGMVCGIELPAGLQLASQLDEPIFTPATKADQGHDENISFDRMVEIVGRDTAETLRDKSIEIYRRGSEFSAQQGIIIADTKFEWGWDGDELILIDEVLTPDSSRFWPTDQYVLGANPPSFDKQFVRDWLETTGWDKNSEPPVRVGRYHARPKYERPRVRLAREAEQPDRAGPNR